MKRRAVLTLSIFLLLIGHRSFAQQSVVIQLKDSISNEALSGAVVKCIDRGIGGVSDEDGLIVLNSFPGGEQNLRISFVGYYSKTKQIGSERPLPDTLRIFLVPSHLQLQGALIEATRTNRTIASVPTRTEVLTEEIDEAASMEPSRISHLLTHSTGIQVQTTSATSNGAVVRIQGLNGRYTQMLRDGFPMYGGFSGSLDVLQIPPLDLRKVEYIKGPASTLYGGGAIAGIVNLLSKKAEEDESLLHLNYSNIGSRDFNTFMSRRFGKFGITNLASFQYHVPFDADDDGFTDLPQIVKINFNPKIYFNPNEETELYFGLTVSSENRQGGDMDLVTDGPSDANDFYSDQQESRRITTQFQATRQVSESGSYSIKNSVSQFNRELSITENMAGLTTRFGGSQVSTFSELSYQVDKENQDIVFGFNAYSDRFEENQLDSTNVRDQRSATKGVFANHFWDIRPGFSVESGLRVDRVQAESELSENSGQFFILPRLNALYKLSRGISLRAGGAMGYRMPSVFTEEAEPLGFRNITAIDFQNTEAEKSMGANFDIRYLTNFGRSNILATFNQLFYYNQIESPILLTALNNRLKYSNISGTLRSRGFESQIKVSIHRFTWFFGYTYTDAFIDSSGTQSTLILTPKHSIKGDLLYTVDNKWRIGWDYEYKSSQLLSTGRETRSLFTTGVLVERTIDQFVLFLNGENLTDTRQTRYESLLTSPNNTPQFTDIWAPLDGLFVNIGVKFKM